jgi:serine/threonine protein kinase/Tfp pilus assembly protein PilF
VLGERYEILALLKSGAMGCIYKARHQQLNNFVAVKMLQKRVISGEAALKRFQAEAQLASALDHPNVLTVHDFGVTDEGSPYLVMAFLEGKTLAEITAGGEHLDLRRSLHIFIQICQGLGHAHDRGVIHCDIKPSNIMLIQLNDDADFVQIVDFGIAKLLSPEDTADGNTSAAVCGSPAYMSPEQCQAKEVNARSDIYSMGCLMYRTLSGKQPIWGSELSEFLYKHINETPTSFAILVPELAIPAGLEEVVFKAMAKSPDDRYQSMAELKAALQPFYENLSSPAPDAAAKAITEPDTARVDSATSSEQDKTSEETERSLSFFLANPSSIISKQHGLKQLLQLGALALVLGIIIISTLLVRPKTIAVESAISTLQNEARRQYNKGFYQQAEKDIWQAKRLADLQHSPQNALNYHLLGLIQFAQGKYFDARANLVTALSAYKQYPMSAEAIADCHAYLGRTATALGQYQEAEKLLNLSFSERIKHQGQNSLSVADSLTGLGYLHMTENMPQTSITELSQALKITEEHQGRASPDTASALNNLGQAYHTAGEYKEAESLYRRGLLIRTRTLTSNSPFLADSYACLGAICASTGRLTEAKSYYQRALAIQLKTLAASDPRLTRTQIQYANLVLKMSH